jgi:hypothetical protein
MARGRKPNAVRAHSANETAVLEAPAKTKRPKFVDMTPQEKEQYYAELKAKRDAKKANKFVAPPGAAYVNAEGKFTFTEAPAEWNSKAQADFIEEDFASEDIWLDYKAGTLEKRAAALRKEAEMVRTGGPRLKGDAKKLVAYRQKFEALRASLQADGVDVDAILASIVGAAPAAQPAK